MNGYDHIDWLSYDKKFREENWRESVAWLTSTQPGEKPRFPAEQYLSIVEAKVPLPTWALALAHSFRRFVVAMNKEIDWEWAQYQILISPMRELVPDTKHWPIFFSAGIRRNKNYNLFGLRLAALIPEHLLTYSDLRLLILYGGQNGGLPSHGPNGSKNPYSLLPEILKVDPKFHPNIGVAKFMSNFPSQKENWSVEVKTAIRAAYNHPDVEPHLKHASLSELRMLVIHPTIAKNMVNFDPYKLPARNRSMVEIVPDCWNHIEKMGLYADMAILPSDIEGPERPQKSPTREARRANPFEKMDPAVVAAMDAESARSKAEAEAHAKHIQEIRERERFAISQDYDIKHNSFTRPKPRVNYDFAVNDPRDIEVRQIMMNFHSLSYNPIGGYDPFNSSRRMLQARLDRVLKDAPMEQSYITWLAHSANLGRVYDPERNEAATYEPKLIFKDPNKKGKTVDNGEWTDTED
ncbi:hypothetical protein F4860DRAFT_464502 [Xylaria cubensis]|nr:hypothetical protein F4860DRAFT_464502 [Xylaria cubensis]